MRRWRAVAERAGLRVERLAAVEGRPVIALLPGKSQGPGAAFYLSSGVHGDEPGAACGVVAWAEQNVRLLRERPFVIFPCLNPHGLVANTRTDHRGLDINRRFHLADDEICGPWRALLERLRRPFRACLCLHEDYDAEGIYVYELGTHQRTISHELLADSAKVIPCDPRRRIDGRAARGGVIHRRKLPADLPGMPEAIELHLLGSPVTLTFETPSEFAIEARAEAQVRFIAAAVGRFLS